MKLKLNHFAKSIILGYLTECAKTALIGLIERQNLIRLLDKSDGLSCDEAQKFVPYITPVYQATNVRQVRVITAFLAYAHCIENSGG